MRIPISLVSFGYSSPTSLKIFIPAAAWDRWRGMRIHSIGITICQSMVATAILCAHVPADAADKALGVVSPSQSGDHLPCDEVVATVAPCAIQSLVVCCADVLALLLEEA